jgi:hypothetical protein
VSDHDDFDFDARPGLPQELPQGEQLLWQGRPDWWRLAVDAFHVRKVALYFAILLGLQVYSSQWQLRELITPLLLCVTGLSLLLLLAWLSARAAVYTLTSRRLVIRFGVALQMTMNLPYSLLAGASVRRRRDGSGNISLTLQETRSVSYIVLWPHVRPWHFGQPAPMLRALPDVDAIAQLLTEAVERNSHASDLQLARGTQKSVASPAGSALPGMAFGGH